MNNSEKAWKRNGNFGRISMVKANLANLFFDKNNQLLDVELQELREAHSILHRLVAEKNNRQDIYRKINKMGEYKENEKI